MAKNQTKDKDGILLVEFKAPKGLVEAFDIKLKTKYSSRSEAIRSLMRTFLEATAKES